MLKTNQNKGDYRISTNAQLGIKMLGQMLVSKSYSSSSICSYFQIIPSNPVNTSLAYIRAKLMGLYLREEGGGRGGLISGKKNSSICYLFNSFSIFFNNQQSQMVRITFI